MGETPQSERRSFHRIPLDRVASVLDDQGHNHACTLVDISLKGALLAPNELWDCRKGDHVGVNIKLDDMGDSTIRMAGEVAHVEAGQVGIECHRMDLDSATLLRRVVELNLADPDLLERELQAMIDNV
jgi:hypothetical protein